MCMHSAAIPSSMCSICTPVVRAAIHRPKATRIKSREIPTWSQWIAFRLQRPVTNQFLCILCKQPIERLSCCRPGTIHEDRNSGIKHTQYHLPSDTIRIGCRVKVAETETFTVCNVEYKETVHKIIPVVMTGIGCPTCQYFYTKAEAAEMGRYAQEDAGYSKDLADPSKRRLLMQYGSTAPGKRTPVIDVSELVIDTVPSVQVQGA